MNCELYIITDEEVAGGRSHLEIAKMAVLGGADIIQLRDKSRSCAALIAIGRDIARVTKNAGVTFIVNDRPDVAIACGADGVHLGQDDMRVSTARQLTPPGFIIGVSVGTTEEAREAEYEGADYVALSPVFSTTSKGDAGPGRGLELLREIRREVAIPVIAIGGVNRQNLREVLLAGADGVAVISAVVACPDITLAARELKGLIKKYRRAGR